MVDLQGEEVTIRFTAIRGWMKLKAGKLSVPAIFKKASTAKAASSLKDVALFPHSGSHLALPKSLRA